MQRMPKMVLQPSENSVAAAGKWVVQLPENGRWLKNGHRSYQKMGVAAAGKWVAATEKWVQQLRYHKHLKKCEREGSNWALLR